MSENNEIMDLSKPHFNQFAIDLSKAVEVEMNKVYEEVASKLASSKKQIDYVEQRVDLIEADVKQFDDKIGAVINAATHLQNGTHEYVRQIEFGSLSALKINAMAVGQILQASKLAYIKDGHTTPTVYSMKNGLAIESDTATVYKWSYEKCMPIIDAWLKEVGRYYEFYSLDEPKLRARLVKKLHDRYVRGKKMLDDEPYKTQQLKLVPAM